MDARPLFRQRNFLLLAAGQGVSLSGERVAYLALIAWIAGHTHGLRDAHSAWLLSLLANTMLAPVLLFAPFAGTWVDRRNLRRVALTCDLLRALTVFAMPFAYRFTGALFPVFALLFVLFTIGVFFLPAKSALTPELVPASGFLAANTWLTAVGILAAGLGTLGGGWLVDHWGWARALAVNGFTYLGSAAAFFAIRYSPRERAAIGRGAAPRDYLRQLRDGARVVRESVPVATALLALGAVWWCGGFLHVAGNLHVQRAATRPGVERLGLLFAALGAGGGLSAWWVNTAGHATPRIRLVGALLVLAGGGVLLFAATNHFGPMLGAAFLMGLATAPILLVGETLLQGSTEPGMRGRVFATRDFTMRVVLLASVTLAAACTRSLGERWALGICGALVAGAGMLAVAVSRREVR